MYSSAHTWVFFCCLLFFPAREICSQKQWNSNLTEILCLIILYVLIDIFSIWLVSNNSRFLKQITHTFCYSVWGQGKQEMKEVYQKENGGVEFIVIHTGTVRTKKMAWKGIYSSCWINASHLSFLVALKASKFLEAEFPTKILFFELGNEKPSNQLTIRQLTLLVYLWHLECRTDVDIWREEIPVENFRINSGLWGLLHCES